MVTATWNGSYITRTVSLLKKIDTTLQGPDREEDNLSMDGSDTPHITPPIPIVLTAALAPVLVPPVRQSDQIRNPPLRYGNFVYHDWLATILSKGRCNGLNHCLLHVCVTFVSIIWTIIISQQLLLISYWYDVMWLIRRVVCWTSWSRIGPNKNPLGSQQYTCHCLVYITSLPTGCSGLSCIPDLALALCRLNTVIHTYKVLKPQCTVSKIKGIYVHWVHSIRFIALAAALKYGFNGK